MYYNQTNGQYFNQTPYVEPPIQAIRYLPQEQIKEFITLPNTKVLLIDKANNKACVQFTDNMGNTFRKAFEFKSLDEEQREQPKKEVNFNNFVTKEELKGFASKSDIDALKKQFEAINKPKDAKL